MLGWFVVIVGIIAIPLPGPGWLIVFLRNNFYKTKVFSALDETNALRQSTY
ncbi:MAG: PGPGW domain-containing protein [Prevotella nigrescens]